MGRGLFPRTNTLTDDDVAHVPFDLGPYRLAVCADYAGDQQALENHFAAHAVAIDLLEPFERIRLAIREARQMSAA